MDIRCAIRAVEEAPYYLAAYQGEMTFDVRLLVNLAPNFIVIFIATVVIFQKCFYTVKGYGVTR